MTQLSYMKFYKATFYDFVARYDDQHLDNEVTVPKPGIAISLREIYRGIELPPKDH